MVECILFFLGAMFFCDQCQHNRGKHYFYGGTTDDVLPVVSFSPPWLVNSRYRLVGFVQSLLGNTDIDAFDTRSPASSTSKCTSSKIDGRTQTDPAC